MCPSYVGQAQNGGFSHILHASYMYVTWVHCDYRYGYRCRRDTVRFVCVYIRAPVSSSTPEAILPRAHYVL